MNLLKFLFMFVFFGCSSLSSWFTYDPNEKLELKGYEKESLDDFSDQLVQVGEDLIKSKGVKTVQLSKRSQQYLEDLYLRFINANELFFKKTYKPKFYVIRDKRPFHFSLPKGQFFFSTGILKKYVAYEGILTSILASDILKSHKVLYKKVRYFPLGFTSVERVLSLARLPIKEKGELNKWAYLILKRSDFNHNAYLSWMQIKNKSALDFSLLLGASTFISREEFMFKKFLIEKGWNTPTLGLIKNSSKNFYSFLSEIRRF